MNFQQFFQKFIILLLGFIGTGVGSSIINQNLRFIVEPQDSIIQIPGSVVFNCQAVSNPPTNLRKISWKKNGQLISFVGDIRSEEDESNIRRSILANGSLHITSLYRARESRPDEYQCLVTDGVGSILSRSAKLQDAYLGRFDEEAEDITVGLGQTARFSCSVQGIPPPTVLWFKDTEARGVRPLVLDSRMTVLPSGSLEINNVEEIDEGSYHCNISNLQNFLISRQGRLVVNRATDRNSPPVFTAVPKSQTVTAGQSIVLECSAIGYPTPTLTWIKNGKTIDFGALGDRYSLLAEGNLAISNVEESDKGTLVCRAENHEDSTDVSATLEVQVPPKALSSPGNFYAYEKEDVELPCKIYGKPAPEIQWFKNGDLIIEGDYFQIVNGNNLKIVGIVTSDSAMYQCFARNDAGNIQTSMHLKVLKKGEEIPIPEYDLHYDSLGETLPPFGQNGDGNSTLFPSAPRELVAALVSSRFVTLAWKPPAQGGIITSYAVFYEEVGSDRGRILNTTQAEVEVNIQGLQPNKRYKFRVVPFNENGAGQSSKEISVLTQPEVDIPGKPRFLKAWPVSPTRIELRWSPPELTNGKIEKYKVFYAEASDHGYDGTELEKFSTEDLETGDELDEDDDYLIPQNGVIQTRIVSSPEASIEDLRIYTEYFLWVVALNGNGPGINSEQVRVKTLSDSPTDTPHNFSAEPASSTSIALRWEGLPKEFQNGIITGYKLKYKEKGRKRADTLTTDGNSRFLALNNLDRGTEYQVKIAALNVNGTGPFTEWLSASTFPHDLDETNVPEKPGSIIARPSGDSITISWTPPLNSNTLIRGYTIGWGVGVPDVYTKVVDGKKRSFTIEKLQPNFEYVISLRASNQLGEGIPIYENVRTSDSSDDIEHEDHHHHQRFPGPPQPQLATPTGLRATIISPTSAVLSWTDTSLMKSQVVTDRRFYVVRYVQTDALGLSRPKAPYKYHNSTQLNVILNNLKPNTMYEFSVKVVRNKLSSEWSLVVMNKTLGIATAAPDLGIVPSTIATHTTPQDLTLLAMTREDETSIVILNWQPPKLGRNEEVRGYLIYYTTNPQRKEWVEEVVADDVLSHQVSNLTPDTKYFFKMAARLNKNFSPNTEIKSVLTPPAKRHKEFHPGGKLDHRDSSSKSNQILLYVLIALSVSFALGSVFLCIYYRNKGVEGSPKQSTLKKKKQELKPPDLWIHHDQMELKGIEKGRNSSRATPLTPTARGSMEFGDLEEKVPLHTTNSLERGSNYMSSYAESLHQSHSLGRRKPKPIKIPVEPFFLNKDGRNPRSNIAQIGPPSQGPECVNNKTYESFHSGSSTASSQQNIHAMGQFSGTSDYAHSGGSTHGTLGRRSGSNLRSFTVPIPPTGPLQPNIGTPQNNKIIRPMGVHHPSSGSSGGLQSSPVKRISHQFQPGFPTQSLSPSGGFQGTDDSPLHKSYSTEDLSQEISNLEGLMKDLNAITASEFQC